MGKLASYGVDIHINGPVEGGVEVAVDTETAEPLEVVRTTVPTNEQLAKAIEDLLRLDFNLEANATSRRTDR